MCHAIDAWRKEHPEGKLALFGHADAVGKEDYNKSLSERRARSVFGFLMKDAQVWEELNREEKWGLAPIQDLLRHLGHDPGPSDGQDGPKTKAAVKSFQTQKALAADGEAGAETRKALFTAFIEELNGLDLKKKDFDDINGNSTAGCSEFNLMEKTNGASATNRRVTVLLLKSNKNFPIQYPCQKGSTGPCKKQVGRNGERRTAGFGCFFYDRLVAEAAFNGGKASGSVTLGLPIPYGIAGKKGSRITVTSGGKVVLDNAIEECKNEGERLVGITLENPMAGELFTISILNQDEPERVVIKDYEFHRYLAGLLKGNVDFPRPEIATYEGEAKVAEDEDGDTMGAEPYELESIKLAGMLRNIGGGLA